MISFLILTYSLVGFFLTSMVILALYVFPDDEDEELLGNISFLIFTYVAWPFWLTTGIIYEMRNKSK